MQILFEYKPHSRARFESNPLEMYKVELKNCAKIACVATSNLRQAQVSLFLKM